MLRIADGRRLPFDVKVPNATMRKAAQRWLDARPSVTSLVYPT